MHLPYIREVFKSEQKMPPLVPVLVGALSNAAEKKFGDIFAKYLDDPANLFVVSSDFCHWGKRFGYTPFLQSSGRDEIHESIEALDRRGMALIETKDADGFAAYLEETKNTVCGRHPIGLFLRAVLASTKCAEREVRFVRYEQSSKAKTERDSSVSYASAVVY
jgi:AmmeMemoRadiSam system protein B